MIFFEIIVQNAIFLESFATELLLPLMDISFSRKRKLPCFSIRAYIQNDTKFDSVKFNLKGTDVKYCLQGELT